MDDILVAAGKIAYFIVFWNRFKNVSRIFTMNEFWQFNKRSENKNPKIISFLYSYAV